MRWSLVAFAALVLAAALGPATMPIYDGIGNPDEPYRYVTPPAGYQATRPPTTATAKLSVSHGQSASAQINTGEFGPQAAVFVPGGAFAGPSGTTTITVTVTPVAPPDQLPADGTIVGNVYRFSATAPGGVVDLIGVGEQAPVLDLRAPTARQPGPVFEHLDNGRWAPFETSRIGNDVYRTRAPALGDWALVRRTSSISGTNSTKVTMLSVAGVLGAAGIAVAALAVRRGRTRRSLDDVSR